MAVQHITLDELFNAIYGDQTEDIKFLISKGVELNGFDVDGKTPLIRSIMEKNIGCVRELIEAKCNIEALDGEGYSALYHSIQTLPEALPLLFSAGANPRTAFRKACLDGTAEILKLFFGRMPAEAIDFEEIYFQLIRQNKMENILLIQSQYEKKYSEVEYSYERLFTYLKEGSDQQKYLYQYLLQEAKLEENLSFQFLATAFESQTFLADVVETKNSFDETPLFWAAIAGYAQLVDLFLMKGFSTKTKNKNGLTPLDLVENFGYFISHRLILRSLRKAQK